MSKPRKKYRPRLARTDVFALAIQGTALLAKADQATMAEPVKLAVDRIAQGIATRDDWQDVFDVLNRLERFATMPTVMRNGADYINTIQGVIVKILDRQKSTGTKTLYPGELEDLRALVDLWVELLSTVTHREYFTAEERAQKKLQTVLRAKHPAPGVRFVEAA